ncbi:alpha/beta hydrolase [Devosia insulae DS-56]|uniref:Alpha/beta hydrolase n=1 Tax=Devosia insulae DS-56 TaxID=1116389 RepID=A0A1E5XQ32_9HYPH|nr:alpha/beta hydrolase [Devosia insulae]OEO30716.1 alpha/beta hydrolase [Devosia insulae DS-56]
MPVLSTSATLTYRTVTMDGVRIFYREAGSPDSPALLMLHGFPSSSKMYAELIPLLADRYHLIAPDYPGFGLSDAPPAGDFAYTFDHLARIIASFTRAIGLRRYSLLQQDYGGPIGMRLALRHPEQVEAIIVQNAVAHLEGLGQLWEARKTFWRDRSAHEAEVMSAFTSLEVARQRHVGSSPNPRRYNPESWTEEFAMLSRPGQDRIQSDLFYDYQSNVASYPDWQAWLRERQPPMLVLWGRYDPSFQVDGASAYARDVPGAEIHILDAGHFALEEQLDEIAVLIRDFLARQLGAAAGRSLAKASV